LPYLYYTTAAEIGLLLTPRLQDKIEASVSCAKEKWKDMTLGAIPEE